MCYISEAIIYSIDEGCEGDHETLLLTVEALKAQLEEQTRLCKEQVNSHVAE